MNLDNLNQKLLEKRKQNWKLSRLMRFTIHYFPNLDEMLVLAHILNLFKLNNIPTKKTEIKYCFDQYYDIKFHGDKTSYLKFLYAINQSLNKRFGASLSCEQVINVKHS